MTGRAEGDKPVRTSAENRARVWAAKYADAQTPADLAVVEFDRARASVRRLPEKDQPRAWKELSAAIVAVRTKFEAGDRR